MCACRNAAGVSGYWIGIRSRIFGRRFRYSGTQGERKLRLFRRKRACWRGPVHETVELDGRADQLKHVVEHHSTPDLRAYLIKLERYSALEADRLQAAGCRPPVWRRLLVPAWTFLNLYVGKMGLLDGPEGLCFCALSGWSRWVAHRKLQERYAPARTTPSATRRPAILFGRARLLPSQCCDAATDA
jgi:hypothetical protein